MEQPWNSLVQSCSDENNTLGKEASTKSNHLQKQRLQLVIWLPDENVDNCGTMQSMLSVSSTSNLHLCPTPFSPVQTVSGAIAQSERLSYPLKHSCYSKKVLRAASTIQYPSMLTSVPTLLLQSYTCIDNVCNSRYQWLLHCTCTQASSTLTSQETIALHTSILTPDLQDDEQDKNTQRVKKNTYFN